MTLCACGNENNSTSTDDSSSVERVADNRGLSTQDYTFMNLSGTDSLGRRVENKDNYRDGTHYVGIFYSLWLGQHSESQSDVYDSQVLLNTEDGTMRLLSPEDSADTKLNQFHFYSKPLFGYYNMQDPYVITRHIEMLTMAGLDYLCFDATNSIIYPEVCEVFFKTIQSFKDAGYNVPKLMFYTNSNSGTTVAKIYNQYYANGIYDDLWFEPNGKPMIVGITSDNGGSSDQNYNNPEGYADNIGQKFRDYFDVKESQWPFLNFKVQENALPWMSWRYPQEVHSLTKSISVSVAQHDPTFVNYSDKGAASSRGYDYKTNTVYENYEAGQNFANEWQTVFDKDESIENVLVTGWNEWMAIKTFDGNKVNMCDGFSEEYSRDIEPMDGSCKDNFYMQLAANIRNYKLTAAKHYKYLKLNIDMTDESLSQWNGVTSHYLDFNGDVIKRDFKGAAGSVYYTDNSNRNDITDIKVVHGKEYLYFLVETKDDITSYNGTDKNWMTILINTHNATKSFEGYDFIINRSPLTDGNTSIEKSNGGYDWTNSGVAEYKVLGNKILYKIPLEKLGLTENNCYIEFKVTDNITKPDDIMNYYVSGDSAPIGRLSYTYGY